MIEPKVKVGQFFKYRKGRGAIMFGTDDSGWLKPGKVCEILSVTRAGGGYKVHHSIKDASFSLQQSQSSFLKDWEYLAGEVK